MAMIAANREAPVTSDGISMRNGVTVCLLLAVSLADPTGVAKCRVAHHWRGVLY